MSVWDFVQSGIVRVPVTTAEARLIERAVENIIVQHTRLALAEGASPWDSISGLLREAKVTISGLEPGEVEALQSVAPNAQVKPGNTGHVALIDDKMATMLQKELEGNAGYYQWMIGKAGGNLANLMQKLNTAVQRVLGPQAPQAVPAIGPAVPAAAAPQQPAWKPPTIPPVSAPIGKLALKKVPASQALPGRQQKVTAQDVQMMQGSTLSQKPTGNLLGKDAVGKEEDPTSWFSDMDEGISITQMFEPGVPEMIAKAKPEDEEK